jgi:hypothetical protein
VLTKNVTRRVDIPHEPGQFMTFRQLSWVQLAEAEQARSSQVLRNLHDMGPELMTALQGAQSPQQNATPQPAQQDAKDRLDQATVLKYGIAGWSYEEPVTPENVALLDVTTAKWALDEILHLGAPPLDAAIEQDFLRSQPISTAPQTLISTFPANGSSG